MHSCATATGAAREGREGCVAAPAPRSPRLQPQAPKPPCFTLGTTQVRSSRRAPRGARHLVFCSRAEYSVSDTLEASMSLVSPVLAEYLKMKAFISSYL